MPKTLSDDLFLPYDEIEPIIELVGEEIFLKILQISKLFWSRLDLIYRAEKQEDYNDIF